MVKIVTNPFRPGAGHMPPYLAGREDEKREFEKILTQTTILENLVLTGLRGVGKTVLLETLKPIAIREGWLWVGTDLSESVNSGEEALVVRLLTDLSVVTSAMVVKKSEAAGFATSVTDVTLDFRALSQIYAATPGLVADKLKSVLETVAVATEAETRRGIVFAYDEAQILSDSPNNDQYPLSLLLDVFQSIQRKGVPFLLVLTGLPTLFPKLVDARTFAERMFHVVTLDKLNRDDSLEAINKPIEDASCPVKFTPQAAETIYEHTGGYPYFIQFICREAFDSYIQQAERGDVPNVPLDAITRKLDTDFFSGRWAKATDRQRDLLWVVAGLDRENGEFTVQEIVNRSKETLPKSFGGSHANQILGALGEQGLVYKNRWGKYSFAVPLFDRFILRQGVPNELELPF